MSDQSSSSGIGLFGALIFGAIAWALWGFPTGAVIFALAFITWDILTLLGYIPVVGEVLYYFAYQWVESQLLPLVHFHAGGWTTGLIFWFGMLGCIVASIGMLVLIGLMKRNA